MINTNKNGPEMTHIDGFTSFCQTNANSWQKSAEAYQKVAEAFPNAICLDTGRHTYAISIDAGTDRVHAMQINRRIYFSLCDGVKTDEGKPSVTAVYPEKISGVCAIKALAIFRQEHPESFEQLKKIIEEHSEAMGSAFEVLPKVE